MKKNKEGSWPLFFIGIGTLIVMTAPQAPNAMLMIIGGLVVILLGVIAYKKSRRKNKND